MDAGLFEQVKADLKADEGIGPNGLGHVYMDSKGIPTIGYGYNLQDPANQERLAELGYSVSEITAGRQEISEQHAEQLLEERMEIALLDAQNYLPSFGEQPTAVQSIVLNMSYNMGGPTLNQFVNLREALQENDYQAAAREMVDSKWYGEVGDRSERLVEIMEAVSSATSSDGRETERDESNINHPDRSQLEVEETGSPAIASSVGLAEHPDAPPDARNVFELGYTATGTSIMNMVQDASRGIDESLQNLFSLPTLHEATPSDADGTSFVGSLADIFGGIGRDSADMFAASRDDTPVTATTAETLVASLGETVQSTTELFSGSPSASTPDQTQIPIESSQIDSTSSYGDFGSSQEGSGSSSSGTSSESAPDGGSGSD